MAVTSRREFTAGFFGKNDWDRPKFELCQIIRNLYGTYGHQSDHARLRKVWSEPPPADFVCDGLFLPFLYCHRRSATDQRPTRRYSKLSRCWSHSATTIERSPMTVQFYDRHRARSDGGRCLRPSSNTQQMPVAFCDRNSDASRVLPPSSHIV